MATHQRAHFRHFAATAMGFLLVAVSLAFPCMVRAQMGTVKVHELFRHGYDLYKTGNYEAAAKIFEKVQANQAQLTPTAQKDLVFFIQQNNLALKDRSEGAALLNQAELLLGQGKRTEAANIVRTLIGNPCLTREHQQRLTVIRRALEEPPPMKADPKALLKVGREFLKCGDLDAAESYGRQADKCWPTWPTLVNPFGDTPIKLLRDIQAERVRLINLVPPLPVSQKEPFWSLKPFKNFLFRHKEDAPKIEDKSLSAPPIIKDRPMDGPMPTGDPVGKPLPKTSDARDGTSPMQTMKSFFSRPLNKETPAKDRSEHQLSQLPTGTILRMSDQDLPPSPSIFPGALIPTQAGPGGVVPTALPGSSEAAAALGLTAKAQVQQLLLDGYKALAMNDLETARRFATMAKEIRVTYRPNEPTPDRLLSDIRGREAAAAKSANPAAPALPKDGQLPGAPVTDPRGAPGSPVAANVALPTDPKLLVRLARDFLDKEQFAEAERLINQAAALKPKGWGLFEDSPDRVRNDLKKFRGRSEREQAASVLVEARKQLILGNLDEAKTLAHRAQKLHGPYSVWDFGDRPQRVLDDINRLEVAMKRDGRKSATVTANKPTDSANSATAADAVRERAVVLLNQAADLAGRGQLIEARQKAMEARDLRVPFDDKESPENLLAILNGQCGNRLNLMLQQAWDMMNNPSDPVRFQRAEAHLLSARQLCIEFKMDTSFVDQGIQLARNQGRTPDHTARKITDPRQLLGMEKLDLARQELKAGNLPMARRLAEAAYEFGMRQEADKVIRSIEAEETNQANLANSQTAEAGIAAFLREDYRQARSIFAAVDMSKVRPDRMQRIREIMSTREMQPETPETTGRSPAQTLKPSQIALDKGQPPGRASVSDEPEDPLTRTRNMEKIQFDFLRERGMAAQKSALDNFKTDPARAIEILQEYLKTVATFQFDPNQTAVLRAPAEKRLAEFRTIQAQRDLEKAQKDPLNGGHNEFERNKAIHNKQEEVAKLMKRCGQLLNDNKLDEARILANQAQELDPDNVAAQAALAILGIRINENRWNKDKAVNEDAFIKLNRNNFFPSGFNGDSALSFDPDMRERLDKRKSPKDGYLINNRSPREKAIEQQLERPISLNFKDTTLSDAINVLRDMTRLNIFADKEALMEAGVQLDQRLTLPVEDLKLKSALKHLLDQVKLTYVIKNEALVITTPHKAKGNGVLKTYQVADLVVPVEDHPLPASANIQEVMARQSGLNGPGGVNISPPTPVTGPFGLPPGQPIGSSGQSLGSYGQNQPSPGGVPAPGTKMTKEAMANLLINLITNSVAPESWNSVSGGPGTIQYFPLGMALVINQTQEVQEDIVSLLAALRRLQDLQVSIEMRLVSVSESFFERMGLDFDVNIRTPTSAREPDLLTGNFTPFGFVNRNLDRLGLVSGLTPAGTLTPDLNVPIRNSSFDFSIPPFGGYPGTLGADGGISLGLAFLSDIQVFMLLEAAQGDRRTNIMQAPKITVFNGQTASIQVTDFQYFILNIQAVPVGAQLMFTPQNTPLPIGVSLQVNPVVSADRRFVRMNLNPSMTNLTSANVPLVPIQQVVPQLLEGPGTGTSSPGQPVIFQMFLQQPNPSTISVQTTVNVPDGGTVLLGGLKTLSEARNEFGPPILSKIPYLSRLFKNVAWGRESSNLMIMVTARIIITEEEEQIFLGNMPPIPRP